jgi:hypothetical protein
MPMKKIISLLALLLVFAGLRAQNSVQYKVLTDEPLHACNFAMGIELGQMDFGFKNIDGLSFNTGVWGFVDYKRIAGADFIFRYGYMTMGKMFRDKANLNAHRQIEIGGYLNFSRRLVPSTNRITLKVETSTHGSNTVETTTFVDVPSTRYYNSGVRAGFMDYGGCLTMADEAKDADFNLPDVVNYNVIGLYVGLFREKTKNVLISTDAYGKKGVSLHSRIYVDAMLLPVSSVKFMDTDYKKYFKKSPVGARAGVSWYPVLTRKEARPDFKGRRFLFQTEVGYRPYDGLYVTGTISIPISRHIKALSAEGEDVRPTKETE